MTTYETAIYYPIRNFTVTCAEMLDQDVHGGGGAFYDVVLIGGKDAPSSSSSRSSRPKNYLYTLDLSSIVVQDLSSSSPVIFKKHLATESSDEYTSICYNNKVDFKILATSTSAGSINFFEFSNRESALERSAWQEFRADSCGIKTVKMGMGHRHELLLYTLSNSPQSNFQIWENVGFDNTFSDHWGGASIASTPEHFTCIALEEIPGSCVMGTSSGRLYRFNDSRSALSQPWQLSGMESTGEHSGIHEYVIL